MSNEQDEKIFHEVMDKMMEMKLFPLVELRLENVQAIQRLALEAIHNRREMGNKNMNKSITLTAKEILDLARFTGLEMSGKKLDDDWCEAEYTVCPCHSEGLKSEEAPDIPAEHYRHIVYMEEYPEEGVFPLGSPIKKSGS